MTTRQNNILVSDIDRIVKTFNKIHVELEGDGEEKCSFYRDIFEDWIDEENKRDYFQVLPPGFDGQPIEDSGTMSWEEYYDSERYRNDVIEFINKFDIKPKL